MRKRLFIALILILMLVPMSIAAADEKPLRFETTYSFAYGTAPDEPEGRSLIWAGTVSGTFDGTIEWWMYFDGGTDTGKVNHWENAQWIIYPDEGGFIVGEEWGSTTYIPGGERANWRANGIVEEATGGYGYLEGRPIHDGGFVDLTTMSGVGKIHINK